ncbi:polysaccharide deacetylase family protein [Haliangium ochraceum]|uniref:Polysaccharide deacetylase n=1 Tax=Haliangium ochraceum (strain DSM 14365 / JCM 11303 / SMP-2) TaxID=502025 RepID=D0LPT6_HALO1|nr:polysaccharide deacetylase family protein [Haliangium ochraceum]ACY15449.1 polysaccharide deacetylase [Haliangium ochraceum DSM 14365]
MTSPLAILCYHRVVPEATRGQAWPYFARGTAVTVESFTRQVAALAARFAFADEASVHAWAVDGVRLRRPHVWMTFDDGYRDVEDHAAPVLCAAGAPATVFVTSCTLATPPQALAADRWYAALTGARRRRGSLALGRDRWQFDLTRPRDRARLVDGPERRRCLDAPAAERDAILDALSEALDARAAPASDLYLSADALRRLARRGIALGAHGATHRPLPRLHDQGLADELADMQAAFAAHGLPRPSALAYPDGAWSASAEDAVRASGHALGLLLGDAPARPEALRLSRYLVPDQPDWVERVLAPALEAAA